MDENSPPWAVNVKDAINQGISRAAQTLRNVKGAWMEQQIDIEGEQVTRYGVNMLVTFVLDE